MHSDIQTCPDKVVGVSDLFVLPAAGGVRMDSLENPRAVAYALNFSIRSALNFLVRPTAKFRKSEEQKHPPKMLYLRSPLQLMLLLITGSP